MGYSINGKVYTDHPLMDEIVYNCKQILSGIIIKNDTKANNLEDRYSTTDVETFIMCNEGTCTFDTFPFTVEIYSGFGYSPTEVEQYMRDRYLVPVGDRDALTLYAQKVFMDNYEEKNDYYRMLMGLPPYGTDEYNIYIDKSYFPQNYTKEIDFSKPLHEMDNDVINVLRASGKLDEIIESHQGSGYSYLKFLSDKKIDLYKARIAAKYDILYVPSVEPLVMDRFKELYSLNREIYLKRTYSEAYAYGSDYYDECMIIMIIAQTFNDMIVDIPEWYIRRDIFDLRSVQYFLDSYGVKFFKEIPLKYQIRIVKNINKLIKFKSSNKNFEDILEIFALKDTSIFKYYLYKKRLLNNDGSYTDNTEDENNYELEFVQVKLNSSYDEYIKDTIRRFSYDNITKEDKYWDGEDEHEYVKDKHISRDFTIEGTKYMSIEYKVSFKEYAIEMEYLLGLILDSNVDLEDIKLFIPSIEPGVEFSLSNLFIFLDLTSLGYSSSSTKIIRPNDIDKKYLWVDSYDVDGGFSKTVDYDKDYDGSSSSHPSEYSYDDIDGKYADNSKEKADYKLNLKKEKPKFKKYDDFDGGYSYTRDEEYDDVYSIYGGSPETEGGYLSADGGRGEYAEIKSAEDFYDWMKDKLPQLFYKESDTVFGFNMNLDLDELEEEISKMHSKFAFEDKYDLSYFGVDNFISATKINTIDDLVFVYKNNRKCYENLLDVLFNKIDNRDSYRIGMYIYERMFTKKFDYKYYQKLDGTDADCLEDILIERDYVLYNKYLKLMSETNIETRKDNIRSVINDTVNTLEYYLSGDGLEYLFSFTTISSFYSLINYIYLMIDFFKSYKVHFLEPFITYEVNDKLNNYGGGFDSIAERKISVDKWDKDFARDNISYSRSIDAVESPRDNTLEVMDVYNHFDPDPYDDYDYDGMYADTTGTYKDANGGYASPSSCVPFIMLNGGSAHGGRINLWDLDGSGAEEMLDDYLDIDGGYPEDLEDVRKDYWGTAFNYIIDGGAAGKDEWITKSTHIKIRDRQIESNVRISNLMGNYLKVLDDGLYLDPAWVKNEEYNDFKDIVVETFDSYFDFYNNGLEIIAISTDEEALQTKIDSRLSKLLTSIRGLITYIDHNTLEKDLEEKVNEDMEKLYAEFVEFRPISWGEIE